MRSLQTIGEVRLNDRKFGIFRRSAKSWPARRRSTNGGGSSGLSKTPNRVRLGWNGGGLGNASCNSPLAAWKSAGDGPYPLLRYEGREYVPTSRTVGT